MKWETSSHKDQRLRGKRRIIKKFLFFPRKNWGEGRWLETVYIRQRYSYRWHNDDEDWSNFEAWTQFKEEEFNELKSQKEKKLAELKFIRKKVAMKAIKELETNELYDIFQELNNVTNGMKEDQDNGSNKME